MLDFFKAIARLINAALDGQEIDIIVKINGKVLVLPTTPIDVSPAV